MQTTKIESDQITLPFEVVKELKGKEIQFIKYQDGFMIKPISDIKISSKLVKLRRRKLITGDPEELVQLKVGKWNEPNNL